MAHRSLTTACTATEQSNCIHVGHRLRASVAQHLPRLPPRASTSPNRGGEDDDKRVQRFVPDFVVEIVSPNNTFTSLIRKKDRYLRLVSTDDRSVYVYSNTRRAILVGNDELSTPLIPGFAITVEDLFNQA
jgi:Uma2 family endonuclease